MTSYYSLIQLTADPVADERINLGLILVGEEGGNPTLQFTAGDLGRAAHFLGSDLSASDVEELLSGVQEDLDPLLGDDNTIDHLRRLSERWEHSVRITTPRASMLSLSDLADRLTARALPARPAVSPRARDRRTAAAIARRRLIRAVQESKVHARVSTNVPVQGQRQRHHVDVGLVNGSVRHAVTGLSLEGSRGLQRARELDALKWLVDDVKAHDEAFPMSILLLSRDAEPATQDVTVLQDMGAEFVEEAAVDDWAERAVSALL